VILDHLAQQILNLNSKFAELSDSITLFSLLVLIFHSEVEALCRAICNNSAEIGISLTLLVSVTNGRNQKCYNERRFSRFYELRTYVGYMFPKRHVWHCKRQQFLGPQMPI